MRREGWEKLGEPSLRVTQSWACARRLIHSMRPARDTTAARRFATGEPHLKEAVSWLRSRLTGQTPGDPGASDSNSRAAGPAPPLPWWCSACDLSVQVTGTPQPPNPADPCCLCIPGPTLLRAHSRRGDGGIRAGCVPCGQLQGRPSGHVCGSGQTNLP